jgi:DNA processing protein
MLLPENETVSTWQEACAAALAGLPFMGPVRLRALLSDMTPDVAWTLVAQRERLSESTRQACGGKYEKLRDMWRDAARTTEPLEVLERYQKLGIEIWTPFTRYPARLAHDEFAPVVLFAQGNSDALQRSTIGIVGTRRCTYEGRNNARRFGRELAEAGVVVASGLALGVDAAAHEGALSAMYGAPPVAVVGNGLDSVYPKRNTQLWRSVRERGLLISESPLGTRPERWRFPARNRILAGLSDGLLVVESHERGGSLITAQQALERNRLVMAVPGSIQKSASAGTNRLLSDGALMACDVSDVLMALNHHERNASDRWSISEPHLDDTTDAEVLQAVDWTPTSTDEVLLRTGLSMNAVAPALARLAQMGWLQGKSGWWQRSTPNWS